MCVRERCGAFLGTYDSSQCVAGVLQVCCRCVAGVLQVCCSVL